MTNDEFNLRIATDADTDAIVEVCSQALRWSTPTFDRALFEWKHLTNGFGRSLILVAERGGEIVAVRPFMRWRFVGPDGVVTAARAVDTATRPDAQGHGLFRSLTEQGLEVLREEDVGFVFNTPNEKSLPGYLKMGWVESGQVAFGFGFGGPSSLLRVVRSRTAADKPSLPTPNLGIDVASGLADIGIEVSTSESQLLTTDHTVDTLLWRFASGPISYRFMPGLDSTGIIVRLRKRGVSRELVVAHMVGDLDPPAASILVRDAMRSVGADFCLAPATLPRTHTIRRLGPTLALRTVAQTPDSSSFRWLPGDIELF